MTFQLHILIKTHHKSMSKSHFKSIFDNILSIKSLINQFYRFIGY